MALSPSEPVSSEKQLLIACARTAAAPPVVDEIRRLCASPLDWEFVVSEAAVNSILPLVARQIAAVAADLAPPSQLDRLTKAARANALRCLTLTAELLEIINLLRALSIQAMPYKGPIIAAQAYGDVAVREFEDLDLIVRQRDMGRVDDLVKRLGYRPNHAWVFDSTASSAVVPGEYDYRDEARWMFVEFHTEFTLRHFPVRPDLDEMSRRLVTVNLCGHEVPTFAPADMIQLLCVHGAKDFWERLSWIADISEFIRSQPRLDWDVVFGRAAELRTRRMVNIGLALAHELLGAPLPIGIAALVRNDRMAAAVAKEIAEGHRRRKPRERGAAERLQFRRRMVAGAFAGLRYAVRLTTQPADEDGMAMRLPRPLAPLYAVLRPLRLWREYRPGAGRSEHET